MEGQILDNQVNDPVEAGQSNDQTQNKQGSEVPQSGETSNTDWEKSYKEYRSHTDRKINDLVDEIKSLRESKVVPEPDPVEQLANQYGVDKTYLLANAELANRLAEKKAKEVAEKAAKEVEARLRTEFEMQSLRTNTPDWDKYEPVMKELDKTMTRGQYAKLLYEEAKRRDLAKAAPKKPTATVVEGQGKPAASTQIDPSKMSFEEIDKLMHSINPTTGRRYMDE